MKRRVLIVLLLLVAGAIVNVAVAWGLCIRPIAPSVVFVPASIQDFKPFRDAGWQASDSSWEGYDLSKNHYEAFGAEWDDCFENTGFKPVPPGVALASGISGSTNVGVSVRSGWPIRAMFGLLLHERWDDDGAILSPDIPHGVMMLSGNAAMLPLRPIWPGFAINTVFYALVLWLLFAAPFALRRRRRIKRGLCPKCAYPVGTNKRCTECGATHELLRTARPPPPSRSS